MPTVELTDAEIDALVGAVVARELELEDQADDGDADAERLLATLDSATRKIVDAGRTVRRQGGS